MAGAKTVLSERWFDQAPNAEARAGLCPPTTRGVNRALGPLGWPRRCRWRPGWPRLYPNAWYRASAHPAACFRGATARWLSRSSRLRMSASTAASSISPPLRPVFGRPAAGAHLRRGGDENLNVGIRADDGADIAAVEHGAGRLGGKIALEGDERRAHFGNGGDDRGRLAHRVGLERGLVEARRIERLGGGDRGGRVVRAAAGIEQRSWPPRGRSARCRDGAGRNARPAACRACPCPTPPVHRWR